MSEKNVWCEHITDDKCRYGCYSWTVHPHWQTCPLCGTPRPKEHVHNWCENGVRYECGCGETKYEPMSMYEPKEPEKPLCSYCNKRIADFNKGVCNLDPQYMYTKNMRSKKLFDKLYNLTWSGYRNGIQKCTDTAKQVFDKLCEESLPHEWWRVMHHKIKEL